VTEINAVCDLAIGKPSAPPGMPGLLISEAHLTIHPEILDRYYMEGLSVAMPGFAYQGGGISLPSLVGGGMTKNKKERKK